VQYVFLWASGSAKLKGCPHSSYATGLMVLKLRSLVAVDARRVPKMVSNM